MNTQPMEIEVMEEPMKLDQINPFEFEPETEIMEFDPEMFEDIEEMEEPTEEMEEPTEEMEEMEEPMEEMEEMEEPIEEMEEPMEFEIDMPAMDCAEWYYPYVDGLTECNFVESGEECWVTAVRNE